MNHIRQHRIFLLTLAILLTLLGFVIAADAAIRVIYFVPNNRSMQWAIPSSLDTQMKAVQQFYADQMDAHGYGQKTFQIETNTTGTLVVHHLTGKHGDTYYHTDTLNKVHAEIKTRFDTETDVYAVFVDISTERIQGNCGIAYFEGGPAMFPVTGECVTGDAGVDLIAHELGHAFNLEHDFRDQTYIMSYGAERNQLSECAATLLNVSPHFNTITTTTNTPATIQMLSDTTYARDTANWTLRFSVNDPDDLYQVQLLHALPNDAASLLGCQRFYNVQTATVTFTMPEGAILSPANHIWLRVIDAHGYLDTQEWELSTEGNAETVISQNVDIGVTYLTLTHNATDSLTPINDKSEWDGWDGILWEKYPNGQLQLRPKGFVNPDTHIPFFNEWDHFFYSHAASQIVYDLSGGSYATFDAYFFLPNPCGNIASVEVIAHADDTEIYSSGELRKNNTQNINITFTIPENTESLTLQITEANDGNACDHYILGNPRLLHAEPSIITTTMGIYPDVNGDGVVNLVDLVIVASRYGETITGDPTPNPDVNRDGIVDVKDIILITDEMPVGFAPAAYPIQTQLLPNYPNPFNPETWIPYILSEPADVTISIYAIDGRRVRHLNVGYQDAGFHINRHQAAYWDGRNEYGEPVASGIYFYTLAADRFTATQKMLITK